MDKINFWCKTAVLISVLTSVVRLLIPEGKSKKSLNTLMSVITVFAFVSPFSSYEIDFSFVNEIFSSDNESVFKNDYIDYENYAVIFAGESETEKYINNILKSYDAEGESDVKCSYKNSELIIEKVTVYCRIDDETKKALTEEIMKICSGETDLIFKGEKDG